jgi:vitamin K-dependent gamma-carboxylase
MVHSWHTQHIKVHFVDKQTGQAHYLNPTAWTRRRRWSSHADMIHQYAACIQQRLAAEHNYTDIELYMDIWRSMNRRFNQRQVDPRVDLLRAEWSPWKPKEWLMPLMTSLNGWRTRMSEIEAAHRSEPGSAEFVELTFVADFSGLKLENFVSQHLNASIELLSGQVNIELVDEKKNYTLNAGDRMTVFILYSNNSASTLNLTFLFSQYQNSFLCPCGSSLMHKNNVFSLN